MPVRSLRSRVVRWPDRSQVESALRAWAAAHPEIQRVGYFGSYARGDWGVGSDLDVVLVVPAAGAPFEDRASALDLTTLPVPADVLVYTTAEWQALMERSDRFARMLRDETVWLTNA